MIGSGKIDARYIVYAYAILMTVLASAIVFVDMMAVRLLLLLLIAFFGILVFVYFSRMHKPVDNHDEIIRLNAELANNKEQITIYETALTNALHKFDKLPALTMNKPLAEDLKAVIDFLEEFVPDEDKKNYTFFYRRLNSAVNVYDDIKAFRDNHVRPFMERLRTCEMPLSADDAHAFLVELFRLSMMGIDLADICEPSINNRPEQSLSIEIIRQTKSYDDAVHEALLITDNPMKTPAWARALKTVAKSCNVQNDGILFSGYVIEK